VGLLLFVPALALLCGRRSIKSPRAFAAAQYRQRDYLVPLGLLARALHLGRIARDRHRQGDGPDRRAPRVRGDLRPRPDLRRGLAQEELQDLGGEAVAARRECCDQHAGELDAHLLLEPFVRAGARFVGQSGTVAEQERRAPLPRPRSGGFLHSAFAIGAPTTSAPSLGVG